MNHEYAASSYDDYLCLKPPFLLWIATLYLSRTLTMPIVVGFGHFANVDPGALKVLRGFWSFDALIPSAIAIVVLYALSRRTPSASSAVRWIWAHGRIFLAASAGIDIGLSLIALIRAGEINDKTIQSVVAAGIDLYFLAYILGSHRVRDSFAEFPPPDVASK